MSARRVALAAACLVALAPAMASAQTPRPAARVPAKPPAHRVEFGASVVVMSAASFGSSAANLTAPDGSAVALFHATGRLGVGTGVEAHASIRLASALQAEVSGGWSRANLESSLSGDFEGVQPATIAQAVRRYSVEGAALWRLTHGRRLESFVRGGAGWQRELTTDKILAADAGTASIGGGVKYWMRDQPRGAFKRLGLRLDVRAVERFGGLSLGPKKNLLTATIAGGLIIGS